LNKASKTKKAFGSRLRRFSQIFYVLQYSIYDLSVDRYKTIEQQFYLRLSTLICVLPLNQKYKYTAKR